MSEDLKKSFLRFCQFGNKSNTGAMDSRTWKKVVVESGLIGRGYTTNDIDLTFVRAKERTAKTLTFAEFLKALEEVATKTKLPVGTIHEKVIGAGAPKSSGTQADNVRLHDNKEAYTGVYNHGGPSNNDHRITLGNLADRSAHDARGVKLNQK